MAWTTPRTWVAGELVTAGLMNTHVRDNLSELRATPSSRCVAYHSAAVSAASGLATTVLALDSEEVDSASMHDTVTNNSRVTIPSGGAGSYYVHGCALMSSAGNPAFDLSIRKNGSTKLQSGRMFPVSTSVPARVVHAIWFGTLAVGDYLELVATDLSNTGNTATVGSASADQATRLTVVGPLPPS
jgi:hypothetical protein